MLLVISYSLKNVYNMPKLCTINNDWYCCILVQQVSIWWNIFFSQYVALCSLNVHCFTTILMEWLLQIKKIQKQEHVSACKDNWKLMLVKMWGGDKDISWIDRIKAIHFLASESKRHVGWLEDWSVKAYCHVVNLAPEAEVCKYKYKKMWIA